MRLKVINYCSGHLVHRLENCSSCSSDFATGNDWNTRCSHYNPIQLHILDHGHPREPSVKDIIANCEAEHGMIVGLLRYNETEKIGGRE